MPVFLCASACVQRSTLMLDPLYRRRCTGLSDSSPRKRAPSIRWLSILTQLAHSSVIQSIKHQSGCYDLIKKGQKNIICPLINMFFFFNIKPHKDFKVTQPVTKVIILKRWKIYVLHVCVQLGENGSPVRPAELGAAAGADQRGGRLPPAAGAEDGRSQAGGAVPPLLEGELHLHENTTAAEPSSTRTAQFSLVACSWPSYFSPLCVFQSSELCVFLVQTLEETLLGCRSLGLYTQDQLL